MLNQSQLMHAHPKRTSNEIEPITITHHITIVLVNIFFLLFFFGCAYRANYRTVSLQVLKKHAIDGCVCAIWHLIKNGKQKFIVPTAVKLWNPYFHWPIYAARSFKQNKPGSHWAIFGFTDNNSPWKCLRISGFQSVGEWNRW